MNIKDKIKGCYLGKNIGGTLGMLYEGHEGFMALDFYEPIPDRSLPNDDLDLQIIWLRQMEKGGLALDNLALGKAWMDHIDIHPDEYGVALWNLKKGLNPPLTGLHNNYFTDGMGAAIRSELWACLFPGRPLTAAHYAYHDASVDHWGEGVLAEMFLAAFQSHLFTSGDIRVSLDFALALLPDSAKLRQAFLDIIAIHSGGMGYEAARNHVRRTWGSHNFTNCVMNLSFVALGLLYGEGDFGKSLLFAVNCGEDSDCTGATAGGCMGILLGAAGVPEKWKAPLGEGIAMGDYRGVTAPKDLSELVSDIDALRQSFIGATLPEIEAPFRLPRLEDFSERVPWRLNGKAVLFDGVRLDVPKHVQTLGLMTVLETEVSFPVSGAVQAMVCCRGLFRFEFDGCYLGMKGDMTNPVPSFHRVRGGRAYNLSVASGCYYKMKITLYPVVPVPDVFVSFGDMDNRHLTVSYH